MPPYGPDAGSRIVGQGYSQEDKFWCVLNISLFASGAQLGLLINCEKSLDGILAAESSPVIHRHKNVTFHKQNNKTSSGVRLSPSRKLR